jgi:hypothetical protein
LLKAYVDDGDVLVISPGSVRHDFPCVMTDSSRTYGEGEGWDKLVEHVSKRIDLPAQAVATYFAGSEHLRCMCEGVGTAELGFKIFGSGMSIEYNVALKQRGVFTELERREYRRGHFPYRNFFAVKVVECRHGSPYRLVHYVLIEDDLDPEHRALVWLEDLKKGLGDEWYTSLMGEAATRCMVRIRGCETYQRAFEFLETRAAEGCGYLRALSPEDRRVICNLILCDIGLFVSRPDLTPMSDVQ